jgi:uncharacterized protein YkwD/uncharacterized membrane protein required for colicin V production
MDFSNLNVVDIVLLVLLGLSVLQGLRQGLVSGLISIAALIVAGIVALKLYKTAALFLIQFIPLPSGLVNLAVLALVFFVAFGIILALARLITAPLHLAAKVAPPLGALNAVGGGILGLITGAVTLALLVALIGLFPFIPGIEDQMSQSVIARAMTGAVGSALPRLETIVGQPLDDTSLFVAKTVETNETVKFNFPKGLSVSDREDLEEQMLQLINDERQKQGLEPLMMDEQLRQVARAHSSEMFRLSYFSHTSPISGSPLDRVRDADIPFMAVGENIAYAPSLAVAHDGLMNSPGHRANILSPDFHRIGIGIEDGGLHGKMFTQEFAD